MTHPWELAYNINYLHILCFPFVAKWSTLCTILVSHRDPRLVTLCMCAHLCVPACLNECAHVHNSSADDIDEFRRFLVICNTLLSQILYSKDLHRQQSCIQTEPANRSFYHLRKLNAISKKVTFNSNSFVSPQVLFKNRLLTGSPFFFLSSSF